MKTSHLLHLYNRAGFGISPNELKRLSKKSKKKVVDELFSNSKTNSPIVVDTSFLKTINPKELKDSNKRQEFTRKSRQKIREFSESWFQRILNPNEILREKMTLFWANHFVCENNQIHFIQQYHNTLRANALGNFGDFTKAISKEPAMLFFLNNKQNKKKSPNENFARELMELFTLGQDNYSQTDVKEAARAFTGYGNNFKGKFIFYPKQHDDGEKTFLNKTGNFNGDAIINIILEKRECALFICKKIYTYFVNESINQQHLEAMTEVFYKDYNIEKLMRFVFTSKWFYEEANIGCKIKSPMELLAGLYKIVPFEFVKTNQIHAIQRILGQELMRPPNVAGWKTGKYWIDSNTIVTRLRLPSVLLNNAIITFVDTDDDNMMMRKKPNFQFFKTKVNWNVFSSNFEKYTKEALLEHLIVTKINSKSKETLLKESEIPLKDFCIQIMSLPEYQLC